jgi:hypothetical protein
VLRATSVPAAAPASAPTTVQAGSSARASAVSAPRAAPVPPAMTVRVFVVSQAAQGQDRGRGGRGQGQRVHDDDSRRMAARDGRRPARLTRERTLRGEDGWRGPGLTRALDVSFLDRIARFKRPKF